MERNSGPPEALLKHCGQQMLPRVLLHVIEPARPVDAAFYLRIVWPSVDNVKDFFARVANVEDVRIADFAQIIRLPARRRIKSGAVEDKAPGISSDSRVQVRRKDFAIHDARGEFRLKCVVVIEPARGHVATPAGTNCNARCQASEYL